MHGLTRQEVAAKAGVTQRTLIRWEHGHIAIPKLMALGLVKLFEELTLERSKRPGFAAESAVEHRGPKKKR